MASEAEAGTDSLLKAYIALGANLGDPPGQIRAAIEAFRQLMRNRVRASSLWESRPENCPPGSPRFVNAIIEILPPPEELPEDMLVRMQAIERSFGRGPKVQLNEARPLDLDLIAWGNVRRQSPSLTLPHPRAHERRFVLAPLSELAPDLCLPGQIRTARELLELLPPDLDFRWLGPA